MAADGHAAQRAPGQNGGFTRDLRRPVQPGAHPLRFVDDHEIRLRGLSWRVAELNLSSPLSTSVGRIEERRVIVLKVELDVDGVASEGFGEAAPLPGWSIESLDDCVRALARVKPGRDIEGLLKGLRSLPSLRFGLELAILDAMARRRGVPLREVFGSPPQQSTSGETVSLPLQYTLGSGAILETVQRAGWAVTRGYSALKLKIGVLAFDEEVERIGAVRESLPDVLLRLDANGAFDFRQALRFAQAVAPFRIDFIEEPLSQRAVDGLTRLARQSPVDIAADESCVPAEKCHHLIAGGTVPVVVLKPMALGGLLITNTLIDEARAKGVRVVLSTLMESAIGRRAVAHLAAAHPDLMGPHGLGTGSWFREDTAPTPDRIESGRLFLGDGPGLGFTPLWVAGCPSTPQRADQHPFKSTAKTKIAGVRSPGWLAIQREERPGALAFAFEDEIFTYGELAWEVERRAARLVDLGVVPGARVGLHAQNSPEWIFAAHAIFWCGATLIPLHWRATMEELQGQIAKVELDLLLTEDNQWTPRTSVTILPLSELADSPWMDVPFQVRDDDAVLTLLFTSGTTGRPKGVPLTLGNHLASAEASRKRLGVRVDDRWLCSLPLYHIGGLAIVLRSVIYGTSFELTRSFEALPVAALLEERPITLASFVPTMLRRLLCERPEGINTSLRAVLVGGGPIAATDLCRARRQGLPVLPTYGMTEASSQLTTLEPEASSELLNSAGRPLDGVGLRIVSPNGRILETGEIGFIEAHGPMVMANYVDEAENESSRWFSTGDVGSLDEAGYLHIYHRRSDLIVTGGENVDPHEVEGVLREIDPIMDVAVVGVDDPEWGEIVAAAIVVAGAEPVIESLQAQCRERLASFKVPRRW
ncbi:MAG: o-succinylbenzoate synthase [Bradymonadaceae bacterium]